MVKLSKFVIVAAFLVALLSLTIIGYNKPAVDKVVSDTTLHDQLGNFGEAIDILRAEYVDPVDSTKLIHGAMKGMLSSLDDYSQFLEKNEYEELKSDAKGEFGG
ncbi:MAG: peptidase S41, partial [Candidatus Omnitrophica bacterium]|nr:peptidase S41 [Candidatus Omnitrophota bacterium]